MTQTLTNRPPIDIETEIDAWEEYYEKSAIETLGQATFTSEGERKYAVCVQILQMCEAGDKVNDAVRNRTLARIQREHLYSFSPEGWEELGDVIESTMDSYASKGQRSEMKTLASIVAPFAEQHGLTVPDASKIGYMREASSALRNIIESPSPIADRVAAVQEELEFIQSEAPSRDSVRDRYRALRAIPGTGSYTSQNDGTGVIMITGPESTLNAIRSMLGGRLVNWTAKSTVSITRLSPKDSKTSADDLLVETHTTITRISCEIIDRATGEIKGVVDG